MPRIIIGPGCEVEGFADRKEVWVGCPNGNGDLDRSAFLETPDEARELIKTLESLLTTWPKGASK